MGRERRLGRQGTGLSRREWMRATLTTGAGMVSPLLFAGGARAEDAPQQPPGPRRVEPPPGPRTEAYIHLNQVGFLPGEPKRAVVPVSGPLRSLAFNVMDDDAIPQIRFQSYLTEFRALSGPREEVADRHYMADFDILERPGRYRLRLSDGHLSPPFSIGHDIYARLLPHILRFFEVQRCGDTDPALHGPCHRDDGIIVGGPRDGQRVDASGGWHDAGDYLKFVETTSFVTALLLTACDMFPQAFDNHLLAHARIGLEWLLRMHPVPGEFYFQVGDASDHETWRLPEQDCAEQTPGWKPRPVFFGVGANLAGRTAAACALAARLYRHRDRRFAARCLAAAESAYRLGQHNPAVLTTRPADFYPEKTWEDDMEWGAVALYHATGRREYLDQALDYSRRAGSAGEPVSVYHTHALAHHALFPHAPEADRTRLKADLRADADAARLRAEAHPYGLAAPYQWGTAEAVVGAGLACLLYAAVEDDAEARPYHAVARQQRDFILGCNPLGLSCLIGAGSHYPLFPHHQIADLRSAELSGALIGGPANLRTLRQQEIGLDEARVGMQTVGKAVAQLPEDAGIYQDSVDDYVTNEPANDYTAKLLLLTAFYHRDGSGHQT